MNHTPHQTNVLQSLCLTARPIKVIPPALLVPMGWLLTTRNESKTFVVVLIGVLASSVFATRLNVITDGALDATQKPELLRAIRAHPLAHALAMTFEALVALGSILALHINGHTESALSMLAIAVLGTLYSYNFLSSDPVNKRWKTHWLGHAACFLLAYIALFAAGFFASPAAPSTPSLIPLMAGLAAGDYAIYLAECSADAPEERAAGLRTLAALVGRPGSGALATGLLIVSSLLFTQSQYRGLAFVFWPPAIIRAFFVGLTLWTDLTNRSNAADTLRNRGADAAFIFGRTWPLLALLSSR